MSWPKIEQVKAEIAWFERVTDEVAVECKGSLVSGRRTRSYQAKLRRRGLNPDPKSLHLENLARDYEYDTPQDRKKAWEIGYRKGLHGYKMGGLGIHWQARAKRRTPSST